MTQYDDAFDFGNGLESLLLEVNETVFYAFDKIKEAVAATERGLEFEKQVKAVQDLLESNEYDSEDPADAMTLLNEIYEVVFPND